MTVLLLSEACCKTVRKQITVELLSDGQGTDHCEDDVRLSGSRSLRRRCQRVSEQITAYCVDAVIESGSRLLRRRSQKVREHIAA